MIQILLVHATSFKSFYIKGGPPFREPIICDTVVLQMQECDIDVKLVEIWQNCAVWWVAPSTYNLANCRSGLLTSTAAPLGHALHIFIFETFDLY